MIYEQQRVQGTQLVLWGDPRGTGEGTYRFLYSADIGVESHRQQTPKLLTGQWAWLGKASCGSIVRKPGELRQPIADSIPWSFGTDEDVKGWTNAGIIDEDTQADVSEFAIAHDRKEPQCRQKWITLSSFLRNLEMLSSSHLN
jgi:hypothetical protein